MLLLWISALGVVGLAIVGNQFGAEYGVVYFFTVFPAALFLQAIKDPLKRKKSMSFFTWFIGSLVGYCLSESVHGYMKAASSAIVGIALTIVFHYIYDRFLRGLSKQSENI